MKVLDFSLTDFCMYLEVRHFGTLCSFTKEKKDGCFATTQLDVRFRAYPSDPIIRVLAWCRGSNGFSQLVVAVVVLGVFRLALLGRFRLGELAKLETC